MRVHRNCCGLDVHKQTIVACPISGSEDGTSSQQKRNFGTMTQQLRELAQWLVEAKVTAVFYSSRSTVWTSFKPAPFAAPHRSTVGAAQPGKNELVGEAKMKTPTAAP
jgi:hypothetical protein